MNKKFLYIIIVLVILVIVILAWYLVNSSGQFSANSSFDFSLSTNPSSGTITQGQSIASTITVILLKGRTQNVQLSLSGCPPATTCSLNPISGYPRFYSTLTIVTTTGTPVSSTAITIKGVGGGKTKTATYTLTVNPKPCTCSSWTSGTCGAGGCGIMQRQQTRSCTPSGCDVTSRCVDDSTCCSCSSWTNGACGVGGCLINQRLQNRTCNPSGCQVESQCISDSNCTNPDSCSDTDGGLVYNITGNVSGYSNSSYFLYADSCNGKVLTEYYCSGTRYYSTNYTCPYNCSSGACTSIQNSCTDTDGGMIPNLKGTVSGYKNNSPYNYSDICVNNVTLAEYYCSGTSALNTTYNCYMNTTTHCYDGTCA